MEQVKINFTPDRIKYIVYERITNAVFDNNGTIFGGYVRDKIISDHYKTIYNEANSYNMHHIHKFWNCFNQPETAARALVAKDMDICMYRKEDVYAFINTLQSIFSEEFGITNISSSEFTEISEHSYFSLPIMMYKRIRYTATVGRIPYVYCGTEICFDFDILIPKKKWLQPPFNRVDMLSNVFIMNKQGIVMSNNTGTVIDKMSILNKQKMASKIMSDIVEFKTQFCMLDNRNKFMSGDHEYNRKAIMRINKMLFKTFPWQITNLPFAMHDFKKIMNIENTCCICMDKFKKNDRCVEIYIDNSTKTEKVCSCVAHDKCIFKYFDKQLESAKNNDETVFDSMDEFEFRCPMRNVVNFKKCANATSNLIRDKLNSP
uniref:Uncharacterized protein n=1 Tax=viral metagenome TaxID=1070528 RepID=A0A6C0LEF3_9ZZZZ